MNLLILFLALAIDPSDIAKITPPLIPSKRIAITQQTFLTILLPETLQFKQTTFSFQSASSPAFIVERSYDLKSWTAIMTNGTSVQNSMSADCAATNKMGFYRLRSL